MKTLYIFICLIISISAKSQAIPGRIFINGDTLTGLQHNLDSNKISTTDAPSMKLFSTMIGQLEALTTAQIKVAPKVLGKCWFNTSVGTIWYWNGTAYRSITNSLVK